MGMEDREKCSSARRRGCSGWRRGRKRGVNSLDRTEKNKKNLSVLSTIELSLSLTHARSNIIRDKRGKEESLAYPYRKYAGRCVHIYCILLHFLTNDEN